MRILLSIAVLVLSISQSLEAETIVVSGSDMATLETALAQAEPGDAVSLLAGTRLIDRPLHLPSKIRFEGAGQDATVLRFEGDSPCAFIDLTGCEDVEISQLTLDGANNPNVTQGISGSNARRLNIHHVTICNLVKGAGFGPHAILFSGANPSRGNGVTDSVISDCRIKNIGVGAEFGGGIRFSWGSSQNRVLRNSIANTGRGGIFTDNGSTDTVIQGNMVTGSGGEGLAIEVWGGSDRSVIEDNQVDHWLSVGGSDYCAVRRNVVKDTSGEYKFCGIEGIGAYCVYTENVVDGGQKIGLSVSNSNPKDYVYWGCNTVRGCNQWGAQFQGESSGIAYHYFYRNIFAEMPLAQGPVWYPGDEGHGFRFNGNCHDMVFEECAFLNNGRLGIQFVGENIDRLDFVRCQFLGNKARAVSKLEGYSSLAWTDCVTKDNGGSELPEAKPFPNPPPQADFEVQGTVVTGSPLTFVNHSAASSGEIAAILWDFDDGIPSTEFQPVHVYETARSYRVTLVVWDKSGRGARCERRVDVLARKR